MHALIRLVQDRNRAYDLIRYLKDTVTGQEDLQAWAAQILGLYRPTLYSKMKKHEIKDQRAQARAATATATS